MLAAVIITLILLFALFGAGAYWVFNNTKVFASPSPSPSPTPSVESFYSFSPSSLNKHSVVGGCCGFGLEAD